MSWQRVSVFLWAVLLGAGLWLTPVTAPAKVFLYILTVDGALVKYDPDTDQIVGVTANVGQGYIKDTHEEEEGSINRQILDMRRGHIVTARPDSRDAVLLDLATKTATPIRLGPPESVLEVSQIIYPRQASRFYVAWMRWDPTGPQQPAETMLTAVAHDGRVLGTSVSPFLGGSRLLYHPNGHYFFVCPAPRTCQLIDGDTQAVVTIYDFTPLGSPGLGGPGLLDVREGRALLGVAPTLASGSSGALTFFTTDLIFSPQSASPQTATGLPANAALLVPGANQVVVQERLASPLSPFEGGGSLHFYDVASGVKTGTATFSAPGGAEILGFHPDGRRLFLRVTFGTATDLPVFGRLVIVDVVARTVIRDRPFHVIGKAYDFVDEP